MNITPGFYGHLITLLSGLAFGKIAVCLEGGYYLPSLAEGAAMTLKALLGDPPAVLKPLGKPRDSVIETINDVKLQLRQYWKCFRYPIFCDDENQPFFTSDLKYEGERPFAPFETRNCYPTHSDASLKKFHSAIQELRTCE